MKNLIVILFLVVSWNSFGQWQGSTGNTGLIYRDGSMILGGNSAIGNYGDNWKFIELHDEGLLSIGPSENNRLQLVFTNFGGSLSSTNTLAVSAKDGLKFQTNGDWQNDKMVILPNGNVGIGTETPDPNFKLSVNGAIRSKEVKVETNWSDFVFYDDYKLPTLQEVETHIKEKGHLKDIPSAKEVEKNGIFLGEMDSKLLQKIEELTLYTIQQQKEIKQQNLKLEKQEKEISELKYLVEKLLESKK